jgi:aerobic carbon-monoxide dehydrogenase large subunit
MERLARLAHRIVWVNPRVSAGDFSVQADGREPQYAQLVAAELGIPALDVKVVPADTDRFGVGHGYNTLPPTGPRRRSRAPSARFALRRSCSPARPSRPHRTRSSGRAEPGSRPAGSDPTQVKTIEEIAMYAHGTGALPRGVEGGLDAQTVYRD